MQVNILAYPFSLKLSAPSQVVLISRHLMDVILPFLGFASTFW